MNSSKLFLIFFSLVLLAGIGAQAQTEDSKLYDPSQDAKADIRNAVEQAKTTGKHVLLQLGGNW